MAGIDPPVGAARRYPIAGLDPDRGCRRLGILVLDRVAAIALPVDVTVVPAGTAQHIVASVAIEDIVAGIARQLVSTRRARDQVRRVDRNRHDGCRCRGPVADREGEAVAAEVSRRGRIGVGPIRRHRRGAVGRAGREAEAQRIAINVARRQGATDGDAEIGRDGARARHGRVVDGRHRHRHLLGNARRAIRGDIVEAPGPIVIGRRCEGHDAAAEGNRAADRVANGGNAERVAVHIAVVAEQHRRRDGDGRVLGGGDGVARSYRGVVRRRDAHRDRRRRGATLAVAGRVLEARGAIKVRSRREDGVAVAVESHRATGRIADGGYRKRVAIRVGIVRQQIRREDGDGRVLAG